jgi:CBS domain containing-hemolysin-like protein
VLYRPETDPRQTVGEFLQPALFLDDSQRLEVALQRMQRAGQRLAMVLGREGDEIGILTLEDILRFLFGEFKL